MPLTLIALTGNINSGKTTVSEYLQNTWGFTEYTFSKPIKEIALIFGFEHHQVYGTQAQKLEINSKKQMNVLSDLILELAKKQYQAEEFKKILHDILIINKRSVSIEYKTTKCDLSNCEVDSCKNYHSKLEKRRKYDRKNANYNAYRCENVFKNGQWNNPAECKHDDCTNCHTENEYDYHPNVGFISSID